MLLRDRQGHPIGVVVVLRDLAELVSLRSRLALSGRLAAVGELAAGIAHEINNPLAFVRANLCALRRSWDALGVEVEKAATGPAATGLLADGEELIEESLEGVDRAVAIIRDVRGLSHGGGDRREPASLNALLDGVLRIASPQLRGRIAVEKHYAPDLPPISCAPQELQQVFLNLVLNAAQAIGHEGSICVTTRRDGGWVVATVEDDGCGIPPDVIERVFDPFFTTKAVGEGTGLGLGIAYEIVRRHRGEIRVESEVGSGARFRVRLPLDADTLSARD
jgi:two-component system NtrC family sensor kinase